MICRSQTFGEKLRNPMVGCIKRSKAMRTSVVLTAALLLQLRVGALAGDATADSIDLRGAHIVVPVSLNDTEKAAIDLLVDEVAARTRLRLPVDNIWPADARLPALAILPATRLNWLPGYIANIVAADDRQKRSEGFRIRTETSKERAPVILVVGDDSRGVLFGVGKLLRSLEMSRDRIALRTPLQVTAAPAMPIRGHQLGYRPKTNSYDAWNLPQWEQYFRDLIIFGCNAIELIPPRSDDAADSPH